MAFSGSGLAGDLKDVVHMVDNGADFSEKGRLVAVDLDVLLLSSITAWLVGRRLVVA